MKVLLTGGTGLAGLYIQEELHKNRIQFISVSSKEIDLTDRDATHAFVSHVKPTHIIDAAARVGGIVANKKYPVEFLSHNLRIQENLMSAAHQFNVDKFLFIGSSCIYPRDSIQPIREEYLLTGILEETNSAYAIAKIAGIELIRAYRRQYERSWISVMPTNLYGNFDNFNLENGHVLAALINRFVTAVDKNQKEIKLWGTGKPRREFLHAQDFARAVILCLEKYDDDLHINIGSGSDIMIYDLALLIANLTGFKGEIIWDESMPDGTPVKLLDSKKLRNLGWEPEVDLESGLREAISYFRLNREKIRL